MSKTFWWIVGWLWVGGLSPVAAVPSDLAAITQPHSQRAEDLQPRPRPSLPLANVSCCLAANLDLDPQIIQNSPVLQRWLKQIPNVSEEIRQDPGFRPRFRLGYSQVDARDGADSWSVGLEDVLVGKTGLSFSGEYQQGFNSDRQSWGADLRYYLLPLGSYVNVAPGLGYRNLTTSRYTTDGLNVGGRVLFLLSRGGGADMSLTQSWVAPGTEVEVGLTTISLGYALTHQLRLSTEFQKQNSRQRKDTRIGIGVEWMF